MHGKKASFLWAVLHSIGDTLEEKVLLKFNEKEYLFYMNLITGLFVVIISIFGGIQISIISFLVTILYTLAIIGGDFCYVKAIKTLPLGLVNLVDSGSIFIILICDIILGYIKPKLLFLILFLIFIVSIYVFSLETNKMKNEITNKKIDLKNIFILITSTIFYASEPYFLKLAVSKGANAYGVNFLYYLMAVPIFYLMYRSCKKTNNIKKKDSKQKKEFWELVIIIGLIFSITSVLSVLAYQNTAPIVASLIMKLQVFIVVIISVIEKTDKMNWKKTISLIVGIMCIVIMSFIS